MPILNVKKTKNFHHLQDQTQEEVENQIELFKQKIARI